MIRANALQWIMLFCLFMLVAKAVYIHKNQLKQQPGYTESPLDAEAMVSLQTVLPGTRLGLFLRHVVGAPNATRCSIPCANT